MWIDDQGSVHTVWLPPEQVLGDASVAALRQIPDEVAETALDALDEAYSRIVEEVRPSAPAGPADIDVADIDALPLPPVIPGLAPQPGVRLADTVLGFLQTVPPIWRLEVLEAVTEVLDRTGPEDGNTDSVA